MSAPDFEQLVGGEDLSPEERERLLTAHEALLAAGPPAELPAHLAGAPRVGASVTRLPSGRRRSLLVLAAAIALFAFSLGISIGNHGSDQTAFAATWTKQMQGTPVAPKAWASLSGSKPDRAGNWRMIVRTGGLPQLHGHEYYILWLTKKGRPVVECGSFKAGDGTTVAQFTEPYKIRDYDGWVVTLWKGPKSPPGSPLLKTSEI